MHQSITHYSGELVVKVLLLHISHLVTGWLTVFSLGHCLDKDEQVEELVIDATLKPAQKEFRDGES